MLITISKDPDKVYKDGISLKIKIPDIVAKIKLKYLIGVTFETSAFLIDFVKNIFPKEPEIPIRINIIRSLCLIVSHSKKQLIEPTKINTIVKYKAIR